MRQCRERVGACCGVTLNVGADDRRPDRRTSPARSVKSHRICRQMSREPPSSVAGFAVKCRQILQVQMHHHLGTSRCRREETSTPSFLQARMMPSPGTQTTRPSVSAANRFPPSQSLGCSRMFGHRTRSHLLLLRWARLAHQHLGVQGGT